MITDKSDVLMNKLPLTVNESQAEKHFMQIEILEVIRKYEDRTGCTVQSISCERTNVMTSSHPRIHSVKCEVSL